MNLKGELSHSTATVKKLKKQHLATFINQSDVIAVVAATIPDPITPDPNSEYVAQSTASRLNATTSNNTNSSGPMPSKKNHIIRGKKLSLIEMGPKFVQKFELTEEEMPFLFVGKKLVRFERGSLEVQQIVDSYMQFKELSGESEDAMANDEGGEYMYVKNY